MEQLYLFYKLKGAAYKKIIVACISIFFFALTVFSQTTNIGGVVNTYHKVVEIIPAKACVRVADITGLNLNSRVMLVQMKGATISTNNNSTFGDISSQNEAGNYEIGTVCYIIGDSVFLFHDLLNTYNTVTGKVQLVQFGEYYSADVIDTVKAASWDSAAGTGGVIAIFCDQDLTLNKPIYADSSGYKGGLYYNNNATCNFVQTAGTGFVYDITSTDNLNGAYKGESVATIGATLNSAKGAPANGGGGGNNHNNSGGGGANLNVGGIGGGNSSSGPFGCNTSGNQGRGGKALSSSGGTKIFLGGGAGAGHANNGASTLNYGGNGGGIIFIWANNINGNGDLISANGGGGGASTADGAGGGGAGGTVIMHVTNYTGSLTIRSNGGNGGLSDNGGLANRCFGGGGGGSGGAIYFTGAIPLVTITVNGGAGGAEINRGTGCNTAVAGAAGSNGQTFSSYTFARSTDPSGYCELLLPSKLLYFRALLLDNKVRLNWEVLNPELAKYFTVERKNTNDQWMAVAGVNANDLQQQYAVIDNNPAAGYNQYRLRITEKNNSIVYSAIQQVYVDFAIKAFTVYPNPAVDKISIQGNFRKPSMLFLFDISGKLLLQKRLANIFTEVNLPFLSPGIYLLKVNETIQKLIIH